MAHKTLRDFMIRLATDYKLQQDMLSHYGKGGQTGRNNLKTYLESIGLSNTDATLIADAQEPEGGSSYNPRPAQEALVAQLNFTNLWHVSDGWVTGVSEDGWTTAVSDDPN